MSSMDDLEVTVEPVGPPVPPPPKPPVILTGPMSEGMMNLADDRHRRKRNDTTEHVCMFSLCLMVMGIPFILLGILALSFYTPAGVILMIVGVVLSTSGAFMAILSAILTLFTSSSDKSDKTPNTYTVAQTRPEIIIESTNYTESFDNRMGEPEHLQHQSTSYPSPDFPDKLDPVAWSNYPEAQNPKSYLNSFGDLPKVLPSPDVRSITKDKKKEKKSKSKRKISITKSMRLGTGRKRTMSRTSLTRDNDEGETSSMSDEEHGGPSPRKTVTFMGNGVSHQSIVTIETTGRHNDDRVAAVRSSGDEDDQHVSDKTPEVRVNGVLPGDIELDPSDVLTIEDGKEPTESDFRNYGDLWKKVRRQNSAL